MRALGVRCPQKNRALVACLPSQDHVWRTTDELIRFHNNKVDEMPCKLESTENPHSFEKDSPIAP